MPDPRRTDAALGLFPGRRTARSVACQLGLTAAQSAELGRIQALYGRCLTWPLRRGRVAVALIGDDPQPGERPAVLVLAPTGAVVARQRATYATPEETDA